MADFFAGPGEMDDVAHETEVESDEFLTAVKAETQIKLRAAAAVAGFPIISFPAQQKIAQRRGCFRWHPDKGGFVVTFSAAINTAIRPCRGFDVMQKARVHLVGVAHDAEVSGRAEKFGYAGDGFR